MTLRETRPDGVWATLGRHDVFRFEEATPAHAFVGIIKEVGGRLVELTARDSFDEQLAEFLLDRAAEVGTPAPRARTIRVVAVAFPPPWSFGAVVVVPPAVARRFEHESPALQRATYWVVPAFEGEFADRAEGATFWHQIHRKDGWGSVVVRWDRKRKSRPAFDA